MAAFTGSPISMHALAHPARNDEDIAGKTYLAEAFSYTHAAGAGTGAVNLCHLPPGTWTIDKDLSVLAASQFAAASTLSLGTRATTAAAEAADSMASAIDVHTGVTALSTLATLGLGANVDVESTDPIIVFATVAAGNIEDNDTIQGVLVYKRT